MACPVSAHPDFQELCDCHVTDTDFTSNGFRKYMPQYDSNWSVYTALQYGVLSENLNLVALLLSTGVDPDSRVAPGVGDTPLQMSARLSNFEMFQFLLSSGADVNAPPAAVNGRTAVQGAAESGSWEILSMLQTAGAHVNAPAGEEAGLTALQAACLNGHSLIAGFLLAHQANLNAAPSSVSGLTPIQAAATYGDIGLVKDLISLGADVDASASEMGTTALLAATKHKSLPLLELLVKNGARVNVTGGYGLRSPLRETARADWFKGVAFLLRHGANVNDTPLEIAASDECVDELMSPLGWAISNNSEGMVELLLRHGADVLATAMLDGIHSQNALTYALTGESSLGLINLLLAKVQDLEKHPLWEDALKLALENIHHVAIDVCYMILEKTSSMPPPLRSKSIQNGWNALYTLCLDEDEGELLEITDRLIKLGVDVDYRRGDRSTLLQRIAGQGYYESCCFLVGHGATINTPATQHYGTPLQEAIKHREVEVAAFLLEHGADVNALPADDRGVTALQAASMNGMLGMAVQLLECGADVSAPAAPKDGRTAIDAAAEHGHLDMVQLLLSAYGEQEDLGLICNHAADYAEKESHDVIAQWLRGYSP
ncbi:ankyrin repeat-containing domain protein [Penicillium cinerascens]|uniref:Ankyrin repeat-containing domain protein n=1 Tax=Penicillium cinerascens TaxID=70096 RepID=A0A9W9M758_9EURO|nr:ankyrin repeat-containing domain protein [Penicillium cinerascens]KAJ5191229.1 ankyrin repeat-containing domain protein [Penicillium cinerascens]